MLLLEKSRFPRDKVCGDGLTPRAVKSLVAMGIDVSEEACWLRNKGLRVIGGGLRLELPWPELSSYPGYGLVRTRASLDEQLARRAQAAGAKLVEGANVSGPLLDDDGQIIGVTVEAEGGDGGRATGGRNQRTLISNGPLLPPRRSARVVVAADGNSSRLSVAMGLRKRDDRPLGVAVRTYYRSPRHDNDYLESWLDLWDGDRLLPGYGWIFGMGDGTSNVGLGLLNTSTAFGNTDYRALLKRWLGRCPRSGATSRRTAPSRCAGPPPDGVQPDAALSPGAAAGRRRGGHGQPVQRRGHRLRDGVGRDPRPRRRPGPARPTGAETERVLRSYPDALQDAYGRYYTLGRVFVELIGLPKTMRYATSKGMSKAGPDALRA